MSQANYTCHGAIAVITLDNPPVNGLGHALRSGILEFDTPKATAERRSGFAYQILTRVLPNNTLAQ